MSGHRKAKSGQPDGKAVELGEETLREVAGGAGAGRFDGVDVPSAKMEIIEYQDGDEGPASVLRRPGRSE